MDLLKEREEPYLRDGLPCGGFPALKRRAGFTSPFGTKTSGQDAWWLREQWHSVTRPVWAPGLQDVGIPPEPL